MTTLILRAIGATLIICATMEFHVLATSGAPLWGYFVVISQGLAFVLAGISLIRL